MARRSDLKKDASQNGDALHCGSLASPVGTICIATDGDKVVAVSITSGSEAKFCKELSARVGRPVSKSDASTKRAIRELREYFDGKRKKFSMLPDVTGFTRFQQRALKAAMEIPYGQTRSYAWLAARAGSPRAFRAAGQVMAHNEVPIIIPCHRVIASSGGPGGFGGKRNDIDMKRTLLELEGVSI